MALLQLSKLSASLFDELTGEVISIRIEGEAGDALMKILGVPEDGTAIQIRTGFMCYEQTYKTLFIAQKKSDLPRFAERRRLDAKKITAPIT